ncbi:uncharacterized protein LOC127718426 [Mytilus californianus]|uniref:uncharacterized protein LOC127718426 n=1 Tax=Mytilus californianus TaxID=6549 RepID=UPI00224512A0|nr:uncharacterized protein LOC127718426 [Mytilus californianus]
MVCVSGICDCKIPETQYHDPSDKSCKPIGKFHGNCSTAARDTSCYPPLLCSDNKCKCELPATQHYDTDDNTCIDKFVVGTTELGAILGVTKESGKEENEHRHGLRHVRGEFLLAGCVAVILFGMIAVMTTIIIYKKTK